MIVCALCLHGCMESEMHMILGYKEYGQISLDPKHTVLPCYETGYEVVLQTNIVNLQQNWSQTCPSDRKTQGTVIDRLGGDMAVVCWFATMARWLQQGCIWLGPSEYVSGSKCGLPGS